MGILISHTAITKCLDTTEVKRDIIMYPNTEARVFTIHGRFNTIPDNYHTNCYHSSGERAMYMRVYLALT